MGSTLLTDVSRLALPCSLSGPILFFNSRPSFSSTNLSLDTKGLGLGVMSRSEDSTSPAEEVIAKEALSEPTRGFSETFFPSCLRECLEGTKVQSKSLPYPARSDNCTGGVGVTTYRTVSLEGTTSLTLVLTLGTH